MPYPHIMNIMEHSEVVAIDYAMTPNILLVGVVGQQLTTDYGQGASTAHDPSRTTHYTVYAFRDYSGSDVDATVLWLNYIYPADASRYTINQLLQLT